MYLGSREPSGWWRNTSPNSPDDSTCVGRGGCDIQRDGDEPSRNEYAIHQIKTSCLDSNTNIHIYEIFFEMAHLKFVYSIR